MAAKNQDGVKCYFFAKNSTLPIGKLSNSFLMQNVAYWPKEHLQSFEISSGNPKWRQKRKKNIFADLFTNNFTIRNH
jgi:hypothetical protein